MAILRRPARAEPVGETELIPVLEATEKLVQRRGLQSLVLPCEEHAPPAQAIRSNNWSDDQIRRGVLRRYCETERLSIVWCWRTT